MTYFPKKSQWFLTDKQIKLVEQKKKNHKLYFALLLKFYEFHQRFFELSSELKYREIKIIANQLNLSSTIIKKDLTQRSLERYRAEIREYFNSSGITRANEESIKQWLITEILSKQDMNPTQLFDSTIEFMKKSKMEKISDGFIQRIINSAKQQHETQVFQNINDGLNLETKAS